MSRHGLLSQTIAAMIEDVPGHKPKGQPIREIVRDIDSGLVFFPTDHRAGL
jgi:hypothetical protein